MYKYYCALFFFYRRHIGPLNRFVVADNDISKQKATEKHEHIFMTFEFVCT